LASIRHTLTRKAIQSFIHNLQIRQTDIPMLRRVGDFFSANIPLPLGVAVQEIQFERFSAEWLQPANARKDMVLMYCHGGGYVLGSAKTHRAMVAKIASETGIQAFSVNYRLAPENPFPSALDDCLHAYEWLIKENNLPPKQIILGGDSAGGGLALATLLALKSQGKEMPLAAFVMSPWTDLTVSGESVRKNKHQDAVLEHFDIPAWARMYYGTYSPQHPLISPLFADLEGLPPILMQVSEDEILFDDSRRFAWKAHKANVKIELQKWKGLVHVWQLFWLYVPEGREALTQIKFFLEKCIKEKENK